MLKLGIAALYLVQAAVVGHPSNVKSVPSQLDEAWEQPVEEVIQVTGLLQVADDGPLAAPGLAASDFFGAAIAYDGTRVVVGAPATVGDLISPETGTVRIYERSGTTWNLVSTLTRDNVLFGASVALLGDTVVVGAPAATAQSGPGLFINAGVAYVFQFDGTAWNQTDALNATFPTSGDAFGSAVAISGGAIVVGAPNRNGGVGAAHVFLPSVPNWLELLPALTPSAPLAGGGDGYGQSLSTDGTTLVIGAASGAGEGYAEAHVPGAGGVGWVLSQLLPRPPYGVTGDGYGSAVSVDGGFIAVGAPGGNDPCGVATGALFVWELVGASWVVAAPSTPPFLTGGWIHPVNGVAGDGFGSSVSVRADSVAARPSLVVGAAAGDYAGVFLKPAAYWLQGDNLAPSAPVTPGDSYGAAVAHAGPWAFVGAPSASSGAGVATAFLTGEAPLTYCSSGVNSQNCMASMTVPANSETYASYSSPSPFLLQATGISQTNGLLVYGWGASAPSVPPSGTLCIQPPFGRMPIAVAVAGSGTPPCDRMIETDVNSALQSGGAPFALPGQIIYAQWWLRDGTGSYFSDAVAFTVAP